MNMLCFRLLPYEEKATALSKAISAVQEGHTLDSVVHAVDPASFRQVPGSPFAYWVSERIRRLFAELPPFESAGRTVRQGLATADDFRFVRAWWEVALERILDGVNGPHWREELMAFQAWCRHRTFEGKRWVSFAKGGAYSPYYADLHLVVNWERDGEEIRSFMDPLTRRPYSRPQNTDFFFRPGLTWPLRTNGLSFRMGPTGCIFGHKGPMAFVPHDNQTILLALAAVMNSRGFYLFVQMLVARVSLAQSFEVGLVQSIPLLDLSEASGEQLSDLTGSVIMLKQSMDTGNETSHVFMLPTLLQVSGNTLAERSRVWVERVAEAEGKLAKFQLQIDEVVYRLYGITEEDRRAMQVSLDHGSAIEDGEEDEESLEEQRVPTATRNLLTDLISYVFGTVLGR